MTETIAGVVVNAVYWVTLAYIEYKDYGKGAKVVVYVKYGTKTFYYPVLRRVWRGCYKYYIGLDIRFRTLIFPEDLK